MKTSIKFINHASVIISNGSSSVLTDPWYTGDAFNKGWNLLHETTDEEIDILIDEITHIFISHEHPDHFSIKFFKTFSEKLRNKSIKVLFQKTNDKRVTKFLTSQGIEVEELEFNKKIPLSNSFCITCIKDGFYDSGLLIESYGEKILNLNDCDVTSARRADEIFSITGEVDVLLTQFSYAAWKGGRNNKKWRDEAAMQKISTMELQINKFLPKFVIPFASFVYFSNIDNFYLNDSSNKPEELKIKLKFHSSQIVLMAPNDVLGGKSERLNQESANEFWKTKFQKITPTNEYKKIDLESLQKSFEKYCGRIQKNNNMLLIKLMQKLSPIKVFKPVIIFIEDLNTIVRIDYVKNQFEKTRDLPMLSMKSESLEFIFKNPFGFDTLTVNGCFEESKKNGFIEATKTLAIENLNNLGIHVEFKLLINISLIKLFFTRLFIVAKKLKS